MITLEEMKSCIQEWYAQAGSYESLFETHYAVLAEANKQAVYMAKEIAKEDDSNA